ncbi:MAG: LXG domain-containing protein [Schleiferilactobacillus harbinensis]|jgi:hypothetical protein|nr:LXG domain-containing protein [Schleiferilactobacillus harbinensis]
MGGLHFDLGAATAQAEDWRTKARHFQDWGENYLDAVQFFVRDTNEDLQGQGYDSARTWFQSVHIPVVRGLIAYYNQVAAAAEKFVSGYTSSVANRTLDEDELEQRIRETRQRAEDARNQLQQFTNFANTITSMVPGASMLAELAEDSLRQTIMITENEIGQLQYWLDRFREYNGTSTQVLNGLDSTWQAVAKGLAIINNARRFNVQTTSFAPPTDLSWAAQLDQDYVAAVIDQLAMPRNLSTSELAEYKQALAQHMTELLHDGWAGRSLAAFGAAVNAQIKAYPYPPFPKNVGLDKRPIVKEALATVTGQVHLIGSTVFLAMLNKAYPDFHDTGQQIKALNMIYRVLDAHIDGNHFLQLGAVAAGRYHFPEEEADMVNYPKFVDRFSQAIQAKYPHDDDVLNDPIDHQMRYWLDKPMVDFINQRKFPHTEGNSLRADFEEWLDRNHIDRHYPDPDLHNRTVKLNANEPGNIKITVDHNHLEIIFSHNDNRTISQWDLLEKDELGQIESNPGEYDLSKQEQIADTDSANYAEPDEEVAIRMSESGEPYTETTRYDSGGYQHDRLDVVPGKTSGEKGGNPGLESQVRNDAKANYKYSTTAREKAKKK